MPGRSDTPDFADIFRKPEVAVGTCGDPKWRALRGGERELGGGGSEPGDVPSGSEDRRWSSTQVEQQDPDHAIGERNDHQYYQTNVDETPLPAFAID